MRLVACWFFEFETCCMLILVFFIHLLFVSFYENYCRLIFSSWTCCMLILFLQETKCVMFFCRKTRCIFWLVKLLHAACWVFTRKEKCKIIFLSWNIVYLDFFSMQFVVYLSFLRETCYILNFWFVKRFANRLSPQET